MPNTLNSFTVPEINLMAVFDTNSRETLLNQLRLCEPDVYEPELLELLQSAIEKLERITDKEFSEISFFIVNEYDNFDELEV